MTKILNKFPKLKYALGKMVLGGGIAAAAIACNPEQPVDPVKNPIDNPIDKPTPKPQLRDTFFTFSPETAWDKGLTPESLEKINNDPTIRNILIEPVGFKDNHSSLTILAFKQSVDQMFPRSPKFTGGNTPIKCHEVEIDVKEALEAKNFKFASTVKVLSR